MIAKFRVRNRTDDQPQHILKVLIQIYLFRFGRRARSSREKQFRDGCIDVHAITSQAYYMAAL